MARKKQEQQQEVGAAQNTIRQLLGRGLTCEGIADHLRVGAQTIKRWEAGKHLPQPGNLLRLRALLKEWRRPGAGSSPASAKR